MVEHAAVNRRVVGSSPTSGANFTLARYHRLILLKTHSPQHQNRAILHPLCTRSGQFGNFSDNHKVAEWLPNDNRLTQSIKIGPQSKGSYGTGK